MTIPESHHQEEQILDELVRIPAYSAIKQAIQRIAIELQQRIINGEIRRVHYPCQTAGCNSDTSYEPHRRCVDCLISHGLQRD